MTHMWKDMETYIFDMPGPRIESVYGKNTCWPIWPFLKMHNPKITKTRWHESGAGLYVEVGIPKYPKERPYFTNEDQAELLRSYMEYANMSGDEIQAWYKLNSKPHKQVAGTEIE